MIKGPEFFVRFVNYTWGDGFLLMAPTIALIMVILLLMIAVWAATAMYCRCMQKKRARTLMKQVNRERERDLYVMQAKNEEQRKEIRRLQYRVNKWREAFELASLRISRVEEIIHSPIKIKPEQEEKENG